MLPATPPRRAPPGPGASPDPPATWPPRRPRPAPPARLTAPTATFDQLQAISAVTNTPLFESFTVLAPSFAPAGAARAVVLTALSLELAARYSPWHPKVPPLRMAERGTGGEDPQRERIKGVRTAARGTTYVWDPATNAYVAASDSGAPAKGARFMLYALSQRTGLPSVPLTSIGYVDLTDSSAGAVGVTLVGTPATGPPATYARYRVAAGAPSVTRLVGFVTHRSPRLDPPARPHPPAPRAPTLRTPIP